MFTLASVPSGSHSALPSSTESTLWFRPMARLGCPWLYNLEWCSEHLAWAEPLAGNNSLVDVRNGGLTRSRCPERLFALRQSLVGFRFYQKLMAEVDVKLQLEMRALPRGEKQLSTCLHEPGVLLSARRL